MTRIDRGDVASVLAAVKHEGLAVMHGVDRIMALVQPADGITLTREEAALAREWFATLRNKQWETAADLALADKLEGKS